VPEPRNEFSVRHGFVLLLIDSPSTALFVPQDLRFFFVRICWLLLVELPAGWASLFAALLRGLLWCRARAVFVPCPGPLQFLRRPLRVPVASLEKLAVFSSQLAALVGPVLLSSVQFFVALTVPRRGFVSYHSPF
jgi:hypothetical protein